VPAALQREHQGVDLPVIEVARHDHRTIGDPAIEIDRYLSWKSCHCRNSALRLIVDQATELSYLGVFCGNWRRP
jgi:hypothetical protein